MKVIMLQNVGGVGQQGRVVEVSDGYALNFLIPQGKAEQATAEKVASVQKKQQAENARKEKLEAESLAAIRSLENAEISITSKATEKGGLFKSIAATDIARAIIEQKKLRIDTATIVLEKPIKVVGEHEVHLKKDKTASRMRLVVVAQ